ncbi:MAG: efflux RND transporter permease subunit, partial [Calditrichota bacterium]
SLELLKPRLPQGVSIGIARDNSRFIKDTVADVRSNLVLGILFTAAVLFLFLHNWGGTIIAALTMPISVIATFTLISAAGFTLNVMSLMGLAISIGILVVNAIVVLENIERMKAEGLSDQEAASKGTNEIALAVAASTLTNIVVFTPMAFMRGMIGPIFQQFGLTVAFATMFSLFISFSLTPMLASRPLKKAIYPLAGLIIIAATWAYVSRFAALITIGVIVVLALLNQVGLLKRFTNLWDRWYLEVESDYRQALKWSLNHRFLLLSGVALLFLFGLFLFKFIGSEFFPSYDERALAVTVEMPAGTRLEETNKALSRVESEAVKFPEVKTIYSTLGKSSSGHFGGGQGVQYGQMFAILRPAEEGPYPPTSKVVKELRARLADIPSAKIIVSEASQFGGGGTGADLEIQLQGENMDDLAKASDQVMEIMRSHGRLVNINSNWELGKPEIVVRPDRARLFDQGGSIQDVAMTLRTLYEGTVATQYRESGDEFDVRVRLIAEDRSSIDRVGDLLIPLRSGFVPLKEVATVEYASGPTQVSRKNKQRVVTVSANVGSGTTGQIQGDLTKMLELPPIPPSQQIKDILTGQSSVTARLSPKLPAGVTVFFGGEAEMMAESFSSLLQALVLASILTYMLLAAILESYRYPLIIMVTLPLALIGIAMAMVMTGKSISIFALMSIVMLVGIVVNNGILLIDYSVELRHRGRKLQDAIMEACPIRLRPIIMSTLATILGMLPLALGIGAGGEMRSPMAIVAIGGLISSTALTLFVIPVLFMIIEARGERKKTGEA